jgi:hypothetical protein
MRRKKAPTFAKAGSRREFADALPSFVEVRLVAGASRFAACGLNEAAVGTDDLHRDSAPTVTAVIEEIVVDDGDCAEHEAFLAANVAAKCALQGRGRIGRGFVAGS